MAPAERCAARVLYVVRDTDRTVMIFVCERPSHRAWAAEQVRQAGFIPREMPTPDGNFLITGCKAPKELQ